MTSVRQLLEKIEKSKLPMLPTKLEESKDDFRFGDGQKITSLNEDPQNVFDTKPQAAGELDFLSQATTSFNHPNQIF